MDTLGSLKIGREEGSIVKPVLSTARFVGLRCNNGMK